MATSNRDRIDAGLQLLGAGLRPFVDAVMAASVPAGRDWVQLLDARNNARRGTNFTNSADDPRFARNYDAVAPGLAVYVRDAFAANADAQGAPLNGSS